MIRSLVAQPAKPETQTPLRRNLERASLEAAIQTEALLWIDVVDPSSEEISWLAEQFDLNPAVVHDLRRQDHRPTLLVYPDYLFISLFEPHISLSQVRGREIHCLVTDNCFITVRGADASAVDTAYTRVSQNPAAWQAGVVYCFYLTAQAVTDAYYPLLDRMTLHLHGLEEKLVQQSSVDEDSTRPIYRIMQQLISLRQMVAPQREVFSNVMGEKRMVESGSTRDLFRHLYERLLRVYDLIDAHRDLASNVLDVIENQKSRTLVDAVNRLTIFSMIFLPMTFLASLFQLNFATTSQPFVLPIHGAVPFILIITAMVISASAMIYIFRREGWL
ncbi:MAG: magnesium transporter CorA family protein [Anaerolineae bacterium]|nr:magnesium transporter CorA family protein [Anaerolineae bacterium]